MPEMDHPLSDLVLDSRIQVEFSNCHTYRFTTHSKVSSTRNIRRRPQKDTWQMVKILGSGLVGSVALHECLTSEGQAELQAVKTIPKAAIIEGIDYYKEIEAIAKFSHKKYEGLFVDFLGWYENDDSVFIAMEYMEYGDLGTHLDRPFPECETREITMQIAEGLKILHENGFAHRDVKPANILVFRKIPDWWVKIGDFGFSKRINDTDGLQTWVGTPVYRAPELQMLYASVKIDDSTVFQYTEKVDIWALGVIAFYMVFHAYPFPPNKPIGLLRYIQGADLHFPKFPQSEISQDCKNFLKAALSPDALKRLSAQEATDHEWLVSADIQLSGLAGLQITETKPTSKEAFEEVMELMQEKISEDFNNSNESPAGENMPMHERPNGPESPPGKDSFAGKTDPSATPEVRIDSPSDKDPTDMRLENLQDFHDQGVELFRKKKYQKAERMFRHAATGRNKLLGSNHPDTRNSYDRLGFTYYYMSKYPQAKKLFQWLLELREKVYGPNSKSTLRTRFWIGVLTCREGNHQEGLSILQHVAESQKDLFGSNHPDTLLSVSAIEQQKLCQSLEPLQQVYIPSQNLELEKATDSMQRCIWRLTPLLRRDNPRTWQPPRSQAVRIELIKDGRIIHIPVSLPHYSFQIRPILKPCVSEMTNVKAHYRTMAELGQRLHGQKEYDAAQVYLETAASGLKNALGSTHVDSLDALYWLGRNQYELFQYDTAEESFRDVADGLTKTLGKRDRKTLNCLHALGLALSRQRKNKEAESVFRSTFKGLEPISEAHDQDLVHALFQIGFSLYQQGNSEEAEPILEDALVRRDYLPGPVAEDTIECAYWLGCALFDLGRYQESEETFRRTFMRKQESTEASSSHWLGLSMYHQGKYEQATPLLYRAFSLRNARLGEADLDILCSSYWLGLAYFKQARYAEAETFLHQALEGLDELYGKSDQDTLDCLYWYGECLNAQHKTEMAECAWQDLVQGHKDFFDIPWPCNRLKIAQWVRSLAPQEKFPGANLFYKECWSLEP